MILAEDDNDRSPFHLGDAVETRNGFAGTLCDMEVLDDGSRWYKILTPEGVSPWEWEGHLKARQPSLPRN